MKWNERGGLSVLAMPHLWKVEKWAVKSTLACEQALRGELASLFLLIEGAWIIARGF